ncbi:MAG: serine/threonine protein kinase [Deltaproteobacteria bacterium]|nr:serine/threonine protein kinase [Deltaproteobacteria bacterium]
MQQRTYRILDLLGRGGYGSVYRAEKASQEGFSTIVALKRLHPGFVGPGTPKHAAEAARRLRDEARLLGLLRHRAIVQVYDLVLLEGAWTIVMEYVEGLDCGRLLESGPVPERQAMEIVGEVANALSYAWRFATPNGRELRLLHRDIKPSNVMVTADGGVKVLDFGIARADFDQRESTTSATILGTRAYMAPERIDIDGDASAVGPEADVYSLGAVLFELLAGAPPPRAALDPDAHALRMRQGISERLSSRFDPRVQRLVEQMTSYSPEDRPGAEDVRCLVEQRVRDVPGYTLRAWAERTVPPAMDTHRRVLARASDPLVGKVLDEMSDVVVPPPPVRSDASAGPGAAPPPGVTLSPYTPPPQGVTLAPNTSSQPPRGSAPPSWTGHATSVPREPLAFDEKPIVPVNLAFDDDRTGPVAGVRLSLDSLDSDERASKDVRGSGPRPLHPDRRPTFPMRTWILAAAGLLAVLAVAVVLFPRSGGLSEEVLPAEVAPPGGPMPPASSGPPSTTVAHAKGASGTTASTPAPAKAPARAPVSARAPERSETADRAPTPAPTPRTPPPEAPSETPAPAEVTPPARPAELPADHSQERRSAIEALRSTVTAEPGTVAVEGDAVTVQLASGGVRFSPGDPLEPGRYEIWARFPGTDTPARAGVVDVPSGGSVVVLCDSALGLCAPR